jgi:hypothetical protein
MSESPPAYAPKPSETEGEESTDCDSTLHGSSTHEPPSTIPAAVSAQTANTDQPPNTVQSVMTISDSPHAYAPRWSETDREEITDFDAEEGEVVERDSRKLQTLIISLDEEHIDAQGEWISARRSQAEELGLCILTHANVLHWSEELYPRAAVCIETEAQEKFLSRIEANESVDDLDELESRRHHLLAVHECAWKDDEFIVRKNSSCPYYSQWANYWKRSHAASWEDGILIKFTTLSERGVPSQDTEFVPVEDLLRSKRASAATPASQASAA